MVWDNDDVSISPGHTFMAALIEFLSRRSLEYAESLWAELKADSPKERKMKLQLELVTAVVNKYLKLWETREKSLVKVTTDTYARLTALEEKLEITATMKTGWVGTRVALQFLQADSGVKELSKAVRRSSFPGIMQREVQDDRNRLKQNLRMLFEAIGAVVNETKDKRMLAWAKSLTDAMKVDKGEVRARLLKLFEEMAEEFEKDDKEDDDLDAAASDGAAARSGAGGTDVLDVEDDA